MSHPTKFDGSNLIMRAPAGAENVQDMHVFQTRHSCVSCWTVSGDELAEINATGKIFLSVLMGGQQPPVYVGSESTCRAVMVDFGPVWPMTPRPAAPAHSDTDKTQGQSKFELRRLAKVLWDARNKIADPDTSDGKSAEDSAALFRRIAMDALCADTTPPSTHLVPVELCDLTFAIQHNPRCPSPWLVRLVGKSGTIDMKPYGGPFAFMKHETTDRLGFGKTLEEAARAALATTEGQ